MEAYCNVVRALEDRFYGIELNHVPTGTTRRRTNSPRSRRGGSPSPRTSLRETSRNCPSTSSWCLRVKRNPQGIPRTQRARSPWARTPRTRRSYSSCLMGMARTRLRP
jgi:hypothetical protein